MTVSYWNDFENELYPVFEQIGFIKKSEQIGMSLNFQQKFNHSNRIILEKVTAETQATIWAELFSQSFGYKISAKILIKTCHLITYYLI